LIYRGALLTRRIADALPLDQLLSVLTEADWKELAVTLQRFFGSGLVHPDLNPGNILRDEAGNWYLIDLDRATLRPGPVSPKPMIARLERALKRSSHYPAGLLPGLVSSA